MFLVQKFMGYIEFDKKDLDFLGKIQKQSNFVLILSCRNKNIKKLPANREAICRLLSFREATK